MDDKNRPDRSGRSGGEKAVKFLIGKGFYIVLFLCLAAIGISGYVILFSGQSSSDPGLSEIPEVGLASTLELPPLTDSVPRVTETQPPSTSERQAALNTGIPHSSSVPATSLTAPPTAESTGSVTETEPFSVFYGAPLSGAPEVLFSGDVPVFSPTMGDWRVHSGVDYFAPVGTEVFSVCSGAVKSVYRDGFKGVCVEVSHHDGLTAVYCGLEDGVTLSAGDSVKLGDLIGTVGTGEGFESALGPHLHLELRDGEKALDPMEYIPVE